MDDFATLDLHLAIAHHILIFAIAFVLTFECAVLRTGMTSKDIARLGRVDAWYGILAGLIVAVGFVRAIYAAKGWAYYSANMFFWAKLGTFAVIGLLSIIPTLAIIRWRRMLKSDAAFVPPAAEIARSRRILWLEVLLFLLLPAFAAAMARGYGMMSP